MRTLRRIVGEHRYFIIIATLLTLVLTFPTIVYVFRTDVFWHPGGDNPDVFIMFWDIWYGRQILTGQADRYYTDLIFYPEGVSLAYHPIFLTHTVVVNALHTMLPISNAFSLTSLLIIFSSALAAYVYLLWLFKDKWLALFGAVIYGFSPHATSYQAWPAIAWIAPMPLVIYCVHRGLRERRTRLIILGGLLAGLTIDVIPYFFVCVLITLGLFVIAMATSRWRDRGFWLHITLLMATVALACSWRLIPMLQDSSSLNETINYYSGGELGTDMMSFFVNIKNPILGPLGDALLPGTNGLPISELPAISRSSFLGYIPLTLIAIGLCFVNSRRKMLPWLGLCLFFVVLHLGSTLTFYGHEFENVYLPKHYLNQLLPTVFLPFNRGNQFIVGVVLPLAIMSCYGLIALRQRYPVFFKPILIAGLAVLVALEYHIPKHSEAVVEIGSDRITPERLAFLDWLNEEETRVDAIRLINLPIERQNSKMYLFYQSLSGYPHIEGAISRVPDSAYNFIRSNDLLNAWYNHVPIRCEEETRDTYLEALKDLADDGFSHIVYHYDFWFWERILDSFQSVTPSYSDDFVSIYRLADLQESCPT